MTPDQGDGRRGPLDPELLAVYLNDHLAGGTAGERLFARAARTQRGRPAGPALARLAEEVAEDRRTLRAVMRGLGMTERRPLLVAARLGELLARLKPNGRLLRRSPLSDLVELEALTLGVKGKEMGWQTLRALATADARLDPDRLLALAERARAQSDELERLRRESARRLVGAP